ncbi:MAG: hypothetical protein KJ607_04605 [Bacteroidetes bacterium]|nr:hypothetical protein [Bacteroidota bacterium]
MSAPAWEIVRSTKENIIKIINTVAENLNSDAPAMELSKGILEAIMKIEAHPTRVALEYIKNEVSQYFSH